MLRMRSTKSCSNASVSLYLRNWDFKDPQTTPALRGISSTINFRREPILYKRDATSSRYIVGPPGRGDQRGVTE